MANANDGSIVNRGRNKWEVQISLGKDPITGKYRKVSRRVTGTKAKAKEVRDKLRNEINGGIRVDANDYTLSDFIEVWADGKRAAGNASAGTIRGYRASLRHVERYLGACKLADIRPDMVAATYAEIKKTTDLNGTSLHKVHAALKSVMRQAHDYGLILRNPCDHVEAPRKSDPHRDSLTADEGARIQGFVDRCETEAYAKLAAKEKRQVAWGVAEGRTSIMGVREIGFIMAVRIALATGMRRGEVLALSWGSVNVAACSLTVTQAITQGGELKAPKTKAGIRTVKVDADTARHLATWKVRQAIELAKIGVDQTDDTPVCSTDTGTYNNPCNFSHWWELWRTEAGFPGLKFHELRHTQATQLLAAGLDVKTVQERLGHSKASVTLDFYAHAIPGNDEKAARIIGNLFGKPKEKPHIVAVKTA